LLAAVRVTATEIKKVSSHLGKANLTTIAKAMVAKYDKALAVFIQDCGMVAGGATTLINRWYGSLRISTDTPAIL